MKFTCRRKLADGGAEWVRGAVQKLVISPEQCRLILFRLVCSFSRNVTGTLSYEIGMRNKEFEMTEFKEFSITRPDRKKRSFVSCMSRMIAFDDWALLLFAMETFRLHGGDLVVAYVNCALKQVLELMKLYEKDGLMTIRHGYKAPQTNSLPYDPDAETEYSNQMANSHECLYEFKESAEFIAFTDWDDVLVSPGSGSFASEFQKLANLNPLAGSFSIERLDSFLPTAFTKKNKFSLKRAVDEAGYNMELADKKVVVKPERVAGVWIHKLIVPEKEKFNETTVDEKSAVILHTYNLTYGGDEIKEKKKIIGNLTEFIDGETMEKNLKNFFRRYKFEFDPSNYPDFKIFYHLISKCYRNLVLLVARNNLLHCPTYKICKYPKQELEVVKIQTTYRKPLRTGEVTWHERSKINFIRSKDGCL